MRAYRVTLTETFPHYLSNKLVLPLNPIFIDKGAEKQHGASFDVAHSPRGSNEEVGYALIEAPSVFVDQAVDTARVSHTSR